jgi:hypothetical protein
MLEDIKKEGGNDAFYSKITDIICKKSVLDRNLMQTYLKVINPGNNEWKNIVYLGGPTAARENFAKIKNFMELYIPKNGDSGQQEMRAEIAVMETMVTPTPEKEV